MNSNGKSGFARSRSAEEKQATPKSIPFKMRRTKLTPSTSTATPVSRVRETGNTHDENSRPLSTPRNTRTPGQTCKYGRTKTSCHILHKGNDEADNVRTPLTSSNRTDRANVQSTTKTPSTPKRAHSSQRTPTKTRSAPIKAQHSLVVEFSDDIFVTPSQDLQNGEENQGTTPTSISVTSSFHIETMPIKNRVSPNQLNRSHSASSITRFGGGSSSTTTTSSSRNNKDCSVLRRSRSEARIGAAGQNISASNTNLANSNVSDGEASRLTVGVRIRPLNSREHGNAVFVTENEVSVASDLGSVHRFTYDHCFSSSGSNVSTQSDIFESMVRPLLDTAFQGYNACLFAYGQTGSGKTYSMMGPLEGNSTLSEQSGIIPRFCYELLKQAAQQREGSSDCTEANPIPSEGEHQDPDNVGHNLPPTAVTTTVEISYLEVYNEKIHDLLVPGSAALRVREHPLYGPYVADLSKHTVNTVEDFQKWLDYGNKKRATAATEMNDKSSRSHTLFTVILTQTFLHINSTDGNWTHDQTRRSQINLVDLAGSERIVHSVASLDRIREGVSINRSLLTLGKVMLALVERRSFVPYRESVLTWLLKDSLGGNSRTSMLATVSPCSSHLDETLSTLRYASQARSIVNTVRVNEGPQDRIIRELRAEVDRLNMEMEKNRRRTEFQNVLCDGNNPTESMKLSEEIEKLKQNAKESKVQLDMIDEQAKRYQVQMSNLTKLNDGLSERLYEKDHTIEDGRFQIDVLNKEMKPLKALLAATQDKLRNNVGKLDEMNTKHLHLQTLYDGLKTSHETNLTQLKDNMKLQQEENDKHLKLKDEEIEKLIEENESLKQYVCNTREELLNMKSLIGGKILISLDEKTYLDDQVKIKENELHLLKENNDLLKNELSKTQSILDNDHKKLLEELDEKIDIIQELKKELEFTKEERLFLEKDVQEQYKLKKNLYDRNLELENQNKICEEGIKEKEIEITSLKEKNNCLEKKIDSLLEEGKDLNCKLESIKGSNMDTENEIRKREEEIDRLKSDNLTLTRELTDANQKLQQIESQIKNNNQEIESIKYKNQLLITEKDKQIELLQNENITYKQEIDEHLSSIKNLEIQMKANVESEKQLNSHHMIETEKYIKEIRQMKTECEQLKSQLTKTKEDLNSTQVKEKQVLFSLKKQLKNNNEQMLREKNEEIVKLTKEIRLLKDNHENLRINYEGIENKLLEFEDNIAKEKNEKHLVINEKIAEINNLKQDNELLKKQQGSTRDELLKALSVIEQKTHKLDLIENEKKNLLVEKNKLEERLKGDMTKLKEVKEMVEVELEKVKKSLSEKISNISDLEEQLSCLRNRLGIMEEEKKEMEKRTNSEKIRHSLQSELNLMAEERSFSEYHLESRKVMDKVITEKEEKITSLEGKYEKLRDEKDELNKELNDLKQNLNLSIKNEDVLQSELSSYKHQIETLQHQLKKVQKLNEELMEEKLTIIKVMEKQCQQKDEMINQKEIMTQNTSLKKDLVFSKEKLLKKSNKIDGLKKKINDLEDLLKKIVHDKISIHQKEASFKHTLMMKDVEVYGFIMDNLYPHHWEHLTRKARDYTEKYKIPYEFERGKDCVIVRHLMLSATTTLNHFQFNQWLDKIEKQNFWSREMDKDWPWEIDFSDYFSNEGGKTIDGVGCDKKAISTGINKTKSGFIDPIIWRDAMVRRHVRGIREDVDALIVHFDSSEDSLIYSILSRLKVVADRLEEVTLQRT